MLRRSGAPRRAWAFLVLAALCFAGTLFLSYAAPRWQVPDTVSFTVTTLYVVFMLLFIFSVRSSPPRT